VSLLRDIQNDATSSSVSVSDLLRRAQILGVRLSNDSMKAWTRRELLGYGVGDELPEYRKIPVGQLQVSAEFISVAGILSNVPLAPSDIPDKDMRRYLFSAEIWSSSAELEALIAAADNNIGIPWSADEVALLRAIWPDLTRASRLIPVNTVVGILDQIRNRILDFSLEIEQANPTAGEATPGETPIPQSTVTNIFHNTIVGDSAVVTNAGRDATVSADQVELSAAWPGIRSELEAIGLPVKEIDSLEAALRSDGDRGDEIGPATQSWIGGITTKLATGVITLGGDINALQKIVHLVTSIF
jgi:AbiTii